MKKGIVIRYNGYTITTLEGTVEEIKYNRLINNIAHRIVSEDGRSITMRNYPGTLQINSNYTIWFYWDGTAEQRETYILDMLRMVNNHIVVKYNAAYNDAKRYEQKCADVQRMIEIKEQEYEKSRS